MAQSPYTSLWAVPSPSKLPLCMWGSGPHLIHASMDLTQMASQSVQLFLHSSRQRIPILYSGLPLFTLKIAPLHGGPGPYIICGSLGPLKSVTRTASRSVQPFLQGSQSWQTDQQTMLLRLQQYVASMQPKKFNDVMQHSGRNVPVNKKSTFTLQT